MKKQISQKEIDKLGINETTNISDDIKNIIILFRNELNTLDKELDKYPVDLHKKVKKKLNKLLKFIINIRKIV
ncbi:MAG: hypothetical protein JXB50_04910 [Spirochaetes bacterium]|nr:hypothetical protein [Spirochaetota bacterium]